jgi:hypothetical protein
MPPLSKPTTTDDEWREAAIAVRMEDLTTRPSDAFVLGALAMHEAPEPALRGWSVTAVPSGCRIAVFTDPQVARAFCELLHQMHISAFNISDYRRSAAMVPRRVRDWVRLCRQHDRIVGPIPTVKSHVPEDD